MWDRLAAVNQVALEALTASQGQGRAILNFLIFSPISLEKICRRPELLEWLSHADVQNPKANASARVGGVTDRICHFAI